MPKKKKEEVVTEEAPKANSGRSMDLALAQIEKQFGKGSIMTLGKYKDTQPAEHISSGSLAFDGILGKGGFVFGRTVELYGDEGSGKSTTCLAIIARAQSLGLRCAIIDIESALDADYAEALGVDNSELYLAQPQSGEEGLSIAETLIKSDNFDVIIFDSVAAINPVKDLEKEFTDPTKMAGRASLLTRFFERNNYTIQKHKVLFICTNQMRANLSPYGNPKKPAGGHALKHAASYRIEIHPVEKLQDGNGEIVGQRVRAKTLKNKLNSPHKEAFFDIIYGKGIDKLRDTIDTAISVGVIEKGGAWFNYGELKFQGLIKLKEHLDENPETLSAIQDKIVELTGTAWGPEGKNAK